MTTGPSFWETFSPHFKDLTSDVLFGDVWERPTLSKRDRSLITVAALIVMYRTDQLRAHFRRALDNGVTKEELGEMCLHLAFYGGWPVTANAIQVAQQVLEQG